MARIELAPDVFDDFERFFERLARFESEQAPARIAEIIQALQILEHSPLIGRPARGGKRELVIGPAARGYVASYRYVADIDTVFVLAIRSQREAGSTEDGDTSSPHAVRCTHPITRGLQPCQQR